MVKLRFAWGFSVRTPTTSAAEMSLLFPPPSTLIGALARGVSYIFREWAECIFDRKGKTLKSSSVKMLKLVASAHFGLDIDSIGITPWSDITHSYAVPYQQIQHRPKTDMWFGVHASGKVYMPNSLSHVIYIINGSKAEKTLGEDWVDRLKEAGYSIITIGGKEGLTVTQSVSLSEAKIVEEGSIITSHYFPKEAVSDYTPRSLCEEEFWDYMENSPHWSSRSRKIPKRVPHILPLDKVTLAPRTVKARLSNKGIGLTVNNSAENTVIILREWIDE